MSNDNPPMQEGTRFTLSLPGDLAALVDTYQAQILADEGIDMARHKAILTLIRLGLRSKGIGNGD